MAKRKFNSASQEDERVPQNEPLKCFDIEELDRFALEASQAPSADLIQQHLNTDCPRCTEYVTAREAKRARAESILDEVRSLHDEDARNDYARVRARMQKNQQSDHPEDRRAAARQRRSLGIRTWRLEFCIPGPKELRRGLKFQPHAPSKDLDRCYELTILRYTPREGRFELAMEVAPSPEHLGAELLLEGDYRSRMRRERLSDTPEVDRDKAETPREVWVTGLLTLDQLPLVAGQRRVEVELYAIAPAPTASDEPDDRVGGDAVAKASGGSKPIAAT